MKLTRKQAILLLLGAFAKSLQGQSPLNSGQPGALPLTLVLSSDFVKEIHVVRGDDVKKFKFEDIWEAL